MKITGAEIVIRTLIERGADTVFGYPGGFVINIYDELYKAEGKIRHITSCHEQGACHAADGYARATGKTGVVIATSGPGATNLVTGIAAAYLDSTPLVAITGNVSQELLGKDSFQEVDITGITMPITKHNYIVKDVKKLAEILREAFVIANSGRPGPVLVDIPKDVQTAVCEYTVSGAPETIKKAFTNHETEFEKALTLLKEAKKPFIYAGGGAVISDASAELIEFAERIDAPIGASMMGLTAVSGEHPRFLGMTGMHGRLSANRLMAESDLIIAVGTRFSDRATGNKAKFGNGKKFIHIDIDPAEIGKNIPVYVSLIGDVRSVLTRLLQYVPAMKKEEWAKRVKDEKENDSGALLDMTHGKLTPQAVIETVCKYAGEDTIIATDVGQHQMWTAQYYKFKKPRTFITSGGLGAMGFGLGASIGASCGTGSKTVLFTSDGSFHMNMNETATVVSNNLPVVIVVLNNNALGMVRQWQKLFFDGRYSHTSLARKTDYVKLGEAFGLKSDRIAVLSETDEKIKEAMLSDSPCLLEVVIDEDEKVLPMIPPGGTIKDIILKG